MADAESVSRTAMERAFDALEASCEAAVMAAVAAAASNEVFDSPMPATPPPDAAHATRRVVRLARGLRDALVDYYVVMQLGPPEPHDDDDFADDDIPL